MWTATWALNTLVSRGKSTDWMVHMLGQAVGGYTNATHGMTLAAVSLPYYRHILPYGLDKFKRFAVQVWGVDPADKTDLQTAEEGLAAMEGWMKELGLTMNTSALGVTEDMLEGLADVTIHLTGGYKDLDREEILPGEPGLTRQKALQIRRSARSILQALRFFHHPFPRGPGAGSAPSSGWNSVIVPQNRFGMLVIRHRGFSRSRMAMVS